MLKVSGYLAKAGCLRETKKVEYKNANKRVSAEFSQKESATENCHIKRIQKNAFRASHRNILKQLVLISLSYCECPQSSLTDGMKHCSSKCKT